MSNNGIIFYKKYKEFSFFTAIKKCKEEFLYEKRKNIGTKSPNC